MHALTHDPLKQFGRRLAALRKERGWSQETLALESGMARSYLSGIERGTRNVALLNICTLADTLGVPPSQLLAFEEPAAPAHTMELLAPDAETPSPVMRSLYRSLTRLERTEQDLVAGVARALARRHRAREAALAAVSVMSSPPDRLSS